jgi:hypothetical protein
VADLAVRLPAEKLGLTRFFRLDAQAPELTHYPPVLSRRRTAGFA